jgi:hypothetical protein
MFAGGSSLFTVKQFSGPAVTTTEVVQQREIHYTAAQAGEEKEENRPWGVRLKKDHGG